MIFTNQESEKSKRKGKNQEGTWDYNRTYLKDK